MSIQIRKLISNDADMFFDLRLESLKNSITSYLSTYEEEKELGKEHYIKNVLSHAEQNNVIFGAFSESKMIGCIGIYPATQIKMLHRSLIWGIYVKPEYRHRGIARSLMMEAISHARNKIKCSTIELCVVEQNIAAKNLFESCGFQAWGIEPMALRIDDKFYNEIHMKLIIEQ